MFSFYICIFEGLIIRMQEVISMKIFIWVLENSSQEEAIWSTGLSIFFVYIPFFWFGTSIFSQDGRLPQPAAWSEAEKRVLVEYVTLFSPTKKILYSGPSVLKLWPAQLDCLGDWVCFLPFFSPEAMYRTLFKFSAYNCKSQLTST